MRHAIAGTTRWEWTVLVVLGRIIGVFGLIGVAYAIALLLEWP